MTKTPQQRTFAMVEAVARRCIERDDRERAECEAKGMNEYASAHHVAPKDTLHALQLLTTAAALLRPQLPVGRPRKEQPKDTNKKKRGQK
jgi:hypothetical protein